MGQIGPAGRFPHALPIIFRVTHDYGSMNGYVMG